MTRWISLGDSKRGTAQKQRPFPSSGASRHLPPEGKARGAAIASHTGRYGAEKHGG
nr:MAG TPA: hypothetical protein [Caudoviricetes sp.]